MSAQPNIEQRDRDVVEVVGLAVTATNPPKFGRRDRAHAVAQTHPGSSGNQSITLAEKVAENAAPPAGEWGCARCPARWGGLTTAHCSACHRTFTTDAASQKHRAGSHERGERHCLDPAKVGLVDAGRDYSCWGFPGRDADGGGS
jgi:hypothetical protein